MLDRWRSLSDGGVRPWMLAVGLMLAFALMAALTVPWVFGPLVILAIQATVLGAVVFVAVRLALRNR